jgi:hypothetical protein
MATEPGWRTISLLVSFPSGNLTSSLKTCSSFPEYTV